MIFISEIEKAALTHYFQFPLTHISADYRHLLVNGVFPERTKLSSGRYIFYSEENRASELRREFLIPMDKQGNVRRILVENVLTDDPMLHSVTLLDNDLWVHQSRLDLETNDNQSRISEVRESEADLEDNSKDNISESSSIRFSYTPSTMFICYAKDTVRSGFRCVVKSIYALNRQEYGFLKSQSLAENGHSHSFFYIPGVHVGAEFIRREVTPEGIKRKKLSLTYDAGKDLFTYMFERNFQLAPDLTHRLALEILKQYLQQVYDRQIIHSDIKAFNICVKECDNNVHPFQVTFIDFDEAFFAKSADVNRNQHARGTPGFLGPEFFNTRADFENQLSNNAQGTYLQTFIPEWQAQFTWASDIYALGTTILNNVFLLNGDYFPVERVTPPREHTLLLENLQTDLMNIGLFAQRMTSIDPEARPTAEEIHHFIQLELGHMPHVTLMPASRA